MPLGRFHSQPLNQDRPHAILRSMSSVTALPLAESRLSRAVTKWWPDLEIELQPILVREPAGPELSARSDRAILEETLSVVRSLARVEILGATSWSATSLGR